ncbi:hypothetical protein BU23DRAFT_551600 [Bimuria novae-zelandiae CBS 107.79]|uniref:Uncharacterized protein n=1 Tax=Bimuria novae-zelandiae CBS 107.79 TaxID=1447943 RepID=A0A6A5VHM1_9PLEO|nr:hypothetical protein BU23DRAFT_551600 [Bimuria novae-zelandiae CBS 107.79]
MEMDYGVVVIWSFYVVLRLLVSHKDATRLIGKLGTNTRAVCVRKLFALMKSWGFSGTRAQRRREVVPPSRGFLVSRSLSGPGSSS